jgi:hypothetical protein
MNLYEHFRFLIPRRRPSDRFQAPPQDLVYSSFCRSASAMKSSFTSLHTIEQLKKLKIPISHAQI